MPHPSIPVLQRLDASASDLLLGSELHGGIRDNSRLILAPGQDDVCSYSTLTLFYDFDDLGIQVRTYFSDRQRLTFLGLIIVFSEKK
jgi:hypothetical protein